MDWIAVGTVVLTVLNGAFAAFSAGRNNATKKTLDQAVPNAVDNFMDKLPQVISDAQKNAPAQEARQPSRQIGDLVDAMVKLADSITAHTEVVKNKGGNTL